MDMTIKFEYLNFQKIRPPKEDILKALGQLGLQYAFPPFSSNSTLLSESAQNLLLQTHPLILWRKEVISGLRTTEKHVKEVLNHIANCYEETLS